MSQLSFQTTKMRTPKDFHLLRLVSLSLESPRPCHVCAPSIIADSRTELASLARKHQASDDDELLVPSDSSMPSSLHRRSSSGSSTSSGRSSIAADSDEDSFVVPDSETEMLDPQPKKSKTKVMAKPSLKKGGVGDSSGGGNSFSFLTAAEQREQGKKNEKKAAEDPYAFLQGVRDVRNVFCIYFDWSS